MTNPKDRLPMPGEEVEIIRGDTLRRQKVWALHVESFYVPGSVAPLFDSDYGILWRWPEGRPPASANGRLDIGAVTGEVLLNNNSVKPMLQPFVGRQVRITVEEILVPRTVP